MMKNYELNPRKIALRSLQIQERVFYNGGRSMFQFSFPEEDRLKMTQQVEEESETSGEPSENS